MISPPPVAPVAPAALAALLTALALPACRTVAEPKVVAEGVDAAVVATVLPRSPDAGAVAAESALSRFGLVATLGGRGRLFPLPDGDVVFTSRGTFFLLGQEGEIEPLGELDVEHRGLEMGNYVDAILAVSGTAKALRVVTSRGHFRTGYVGSSFELGPKGFAKKTVAAYDLAARAGDATIAYDAPVLVDASPFAPERHRGKLVVVSGARKAPLAPSPTFVVTSLAGTAQGTLFALGRSQPEEGPLRDPPDTLVVWSKDAVKPSVVSLPAATPPPGESEGGSLELASRAVVLARTPDDVWVAGPRKRLLRGAPTSLAPVPVPTACEEILSAWLGAGEQVYLLCTASNGGDRIALPRTTLFARSGSGPFAPVVLPERKLASYGITTRSAFYNVALGLPVEVERGAAVGTDEDGDVRVLGGFSRGASSWLLAHDREGDRTLLLREGARGPVRSLDHELTLRENATPAPPATRTCPGIFVSFGEATPELFERAKRATAGEGPWTLLRGRLHDREHVGVYAMDRDAFKSASALAEQMKKKGLPSKLLCRRPVVSAAEPKE
jgi:hypothetical protein